jgi:hypothetical protein
MASNIAADIKDMMGRPLGIGDAVACRSPSRQSLEVGRITKITAKKVRINWTRNSYEHTQYSYPCDCIKIDLDAYFAYALTHS